MLTKESFMQACKASQSDKFCVCHFEHKKKASHVGNVEKLTEKLLYTEKQAQYKLSYLIDFPGVTEANLQKTCEETRGYWTAVNALEGASESTNVEGWAKVDAARKSIEAEKIKAEKIFVSYKKSHGMIIMKEGHERDEVHDSFSTHAGSYCGRRSYSDYLTEAINTPPSAPRFTGRVLHRSPCAE